MPTMDEPRNLPHEVLLPRTERTAEALNVSFVLGSTEYRASVSSSRGLGHESDSLLALGLLPAMTIGRRLRLPGAVSPRLLSAVPQIQDIYRVWDQDRFERVAVEAEVREVEPGTPASGVGCFFSGGVDSFYTVLKRREEITHLIFAHGFDIPLEDTSRRKRAVAAAHAVADELDKSLIEVQTNLAPFCHELGVGWDLYHGAALATVALLFQDRLGKVLIPATSSYAHLIPMGSHPILDPLWSTEQTTIEHVGCEVTRVEKAAYISEHPVAMRYLRVCLAPDTDYNCGRCEKCLRTIINLRAAGVSGKCQTLPEEPDLEAIAGMELRGDNSRRIRVLENLSALERLGNEPELVRALETAYERNFVGEGAMKQLAAMRAELEDTKRRVSRLATKHRQLKARNEELGVQNERLRNLYSSRRYKVADAVANAVLKVPGIKRLLGPRKAGDARKRSR